MNTIFYKNLLQCLEEKGIGDGELKSFSKEVGIPYTTLHKCLRIPGHVLKWDQLVILAEKFNVSIDWLLTGEEKTHIPTDYSYIPKYKARLSGGPGSFETSAEIENYCAFRSGWLKKKWDISKLALFEVRGDSMSPIMVHGDVVLVDRTLVDLHDIIDGKIYAFSEDKTVRVKRLMWRGAELWAISDNKTETPDNPIDQSTFNLIGRVVWVGHEVG